MEKSGSSMDNVLQYIQKAEKILKDAENLDY